MSEQQAQSALTLTQLYRYLSQAIVEVPQLNGAWIVGETVDVRRSGGHCYFELVEKDNNGKVLARARATIWAGAYYKIAQHLQYATGLQFESNLKVMVFGIVSCHPVYGLSINVTAINPAYSLGEAMQRRNELINQLKAEGLLYKNREVEWPIFPKRVAVISAQGAAGYGDFMDHLTHNKQGLKFETYLFNAVMQGENAPRSILTALEEIMGDLDDEGCASKWDCVVIIRGGGATTDLVAFDDYELAKCIATYPLPVVIGIGHERDITLLDYVANTRVKTPTAASDWLIHLGDVQLERLRTIAMQINQLAMDRISGCNQQLAYIDGNLPALVQSVVTRAQRRIDNAQAMLTATADYKLRPQQSRLDSIEAWLPQATKFLIDKAAAKLESIEQLLLALSPEATLRRGYTITSVNGHAVSSSAQVKPGDVIETTFADGSVKSIASENK